MLLRPIGFSIPSTTELKITFSEDVSTSINISNFKVESLNGAVDNLEVRGIIIDGKSVTIKTSPQVEKNYYLLKLLDSTEQSFISKKGNALVNDNVSRELFFVGIDTVNPIRDRMLQAAPSIVDVDNTVVKEVFSTESRELYQAQKTIGQVLSDNYLCEEVSDEIRTRSSGAYDRLANEQAFKVTRVSDQLSDANLRRKIISYNNSNALIDLQKFPIYPISLQERIVINEEVTNSESENSFSGFLLNLSNKNIIRVISIKLIRDGEVIDCNGSIGTDYNLKKYKYTLNTNFYDQELAFEFNNLEKNQVLLSEFGNLNRPSVDDKFLVSYIYKDLSIHPEVDSVEVSRVESSNFESIPSNSVRFFLNNAPIVNSDNEIYTKNGVTFQKSENNSSTPAEFKIELPFNISRLPQKPGEYTINYNTGEVILVGPDSNNGGTGRNNFVASYNYRKVFTENIDYAISENNLVALTDRGLSSREAQVFLQYDRQYVEGENYNFKSHIEVLREFVENRIKDSFTIETKNAPITNVFRVFNQTTGEVYQQNGFSETEIYFTGRRSPEIATQEMEAAKFLKVSREELKPIGEFVSPIISTTITNNSSNNSIEFDPPIPSEFVSQNSTNYLIREVEESESEVQVNDLQIRFFGTPNSQGLIDSLGISQTSVAPSVGTEVIIGLKSYIINLENELILNKKESAIGSILNSSVTFNSNLFINEKFYQDISLNPGFKNTPDNLKLSLNTEKGDDFYSNLSRLRKVGDYLIDYRFGLVYLATSIEQNRDLGYIKYSYGTHDSKFKNIITGSGAYKKETINTDNILSEIQYNDISNTNNSLKIEDLEYGISIFDNLTVSPNSTGTLSLTSEVLEDYTAVVPYKIKNIETIIRKTDLTGKDLNSQIESFRELESDKSNLLKSSRNGGKNIYNNSDISFYDNIIDFKKSIDRKIYIGSSGDLEVFIRDLNLETLLSLTKKSTGSLIFDENLNISKIKDLNIISVNYNSGTADILVSTESSLSQIDTDGDFLIDSDGNRFKITAVNSSSEIITVSLPSENTGVSLITTGQGSVVVKPTLTSTATGLQIALPLDSGLLEGDTVTIVYLTDLIPDIGTPLAIDYSYGDIYLDYTYLKDNLVIYYEYGDNSIDWSISNTLEEGENYFVDYQYGALRTGLQNNFGNLTKLPFLRSFSLDIDREIYRNAIKGVLQSYPKGPVTSSYKNLVESLTDIEPEIKELAFDQWILGRDHLEPGKITSEGDIEFKNAKFDSGILINDGSSVYTPAISSLSLREGTLDTWVIPQWDGISDDALITFDIDNIGKERQVFSREKNLFAEGWIYESLGNISNSEIRNNDFFDFSSIENKYYNYNTNSDGELVQGNGALKLIRSNLDITTKAEIQIDLKIDRIGLNIDGLNLVDPISAFDTSSSNSKNGLNVIISDGNKIQNAKLSFKRIGNLSSPTFTVNNETTLPDEGLLIQTRYCSCDISNNISLYEKFNNLIIELSPDTPFTLNSISAIPDNILTDSPSIYMVLDSNGKFFQIKGFLGQSGKQYFNSLPDEAVTKIYLEKPDIGNRNIMTEGNDLINQNLPSGNIYLLYKTFETSAGSDSASYYNSENIYALNWSDYNKIKIISDPQNNKVDYYVNNIKIEKFYTDNDLISELDFNGFGIWNDSNLLMDVSFTDITTVIHNRYDLSDIYIGRNSFNPKSSPFTISKENFPNVTIGTPKNLNTDEGLFIWYDELCLSQLLNDAGQWVFRTRINKSVRRPISVNISGNTFDTTFEEFDYNFKLTGRIRTSGEFSSVVRSRRDQLGNCIGSSECNATYRYCGNEELQNGWRKLDDSNSDLINTIIGGTETSSVSWIKNGSFSTNPSAGIYRIGPSIGSVKCDDPIKSSEMFWTQNPCPNGNLEYSVSAKVVQSETYSNLPVEYSFDGGRFTGISPIQISDSDFRIKLLLARNSFGQNLVVVVDNHNFENTIIDLISFNWDNSLFNEYTIIKNNETQIVSVLINDLIYSQTPLSNFGTPQDFVESNNFTINKDFISLSISENLENISNAPSNIIDIDLIEYSGNYQEGDGYLENTDILTDTDSEIIFEFNHDDFDAVFEGGYVDSYSDAYADIFASDEILFNSDRLRYLLDTGKSEDDGRISIFKDGKGFLNFRVYKNKDTESEFYNIATNIKHFKSGELHHIGASWKLGTYDENDEMHLFIDGQEAPNIYKFGGKIPVSINNKFSDISKESLQNYLTRDVEFCEVYEGGSVTATLSTFTATSEVFSSDMIGRSILITSSNLGPTLVNKEYVIKEVISSTQVRFGRGKDLDLVTFAISTNDIFWQFAPSAGIRSSILTDLNNSRFSITRVDNLESEQDMVGLLYRVVNGQIDYLNYEKISEPKYRANIDTRIIEFVGENTNCEVVATVDYTDIDIYIKTYGLNVERCRQKINLSSNTYTSNNNASSFIRTKGIEPTDILDVEITRVVLDTTIIEQDTLTGNVSDFIIDISGQTNKLSSENISTVFKQNGGRKLSIIFDSDNVNYCDYNTEDGYSDGYQDGLDNTITIYGTTIDGVNEETFYIRKNGEIKGSRLFTSVDKIEGTLNVVDSEYYEVASISVEESDFITIQNGTSDYAEIYEYKNGRFILTLNGSAGLVPFELSSGCYKIDYPAPLKIPISEIGKNLYIGTDLNKKNAFNGIIDEFRILNEISTDTKDGENINSSVRSITSAYNKSSPHCPDENTLFLSHFDDPIELQSRSLRKIKYLDEDNNITYNLTVSKRDSLLESINNIDEFVLKMILFGFDRETALKTYYSSNMADGGPLFNSAKYYNNYKNLKISSNSVNSNFGKSAIFDYGPGLIIENRNNIFRKDQGTIEFWISPQIDTDIDNQARYYFDTMTVTHSYIDSISSNIIKIPSAAKEIRQIRLISNTREFSTILSASDGENIMFDEILRSETSGILEGGTGVEKDFSKGAKLSSDGKTIFLKDSLPGTKIKVLVSYIPKSSNGDRVSIFKNSNGKIVFTIQSNGDEISSEVSVNWKKNTWHRISASYRFIKSEGASLVRFSVDGENGGIIKYGTGLLFGDGWIYGQGLSGSEGSSIQLSSGLFDDLNYIAFGSDIFGQNTARARMDNIRLSRVNRNIVQDISNNFVDLEFTQNIETAVPVIEDDGTTYIKNFDTNDELINKFATIRDPKFGIFDFKIDIIDNFDKVIGKSDGRIEELLEDLINNLKPAHTNVFVKFRKDQC